VDCKCKIILILSKLMWEFLIKKIVCVLKNDSDYNFKLFLR